MPETVAQPIVAEFDAARTGLRSILEAHAAIQADPKLTPAGKADRVAALKAGSVKQYVGLLDRLEQRSAELAANIAALESYAAGGMVPIYTPDGQWVSWKDPAPVTPTQRELRREIRDRCHAMPPEQVRRLYTQAVERGDEDFVRAIEDGPKAFPLVDEPTIASMRKWRIDRSPAAQRLGHLRSAQMAMEEIALKARRELKERLHI